MLLISTCDMLSCGKQKWYRQIMHLLTKMMEHNLDSPHFSCALSNESNPSEENTENCPSYSLQQWAALYGLLTMALLLSSIIAATVPCWHNGWKISLTAGKGIHRWDKVDMDYIGGINNESRLAISVLTNISMKIKSYDKMIFIL